MPVPVSYTEATLAEYMHNVLGAVADALGWSVAGDSYAEAITETLLACDVADIAQLSGADDMRKLRAIARREVWRAVVHATTAHYDMSADGLSAHRSQINEQAHKMLVAAEIDAALYDDTAGGWRVSAEKVSHEDDPYAEREAGE